MPKSKRNKLVSLTKTKKKGRNAKEDLIETIKESLEEYKYQYVFSFENMRAGPFKGMSLALKADTKVFMGKNKVMRIALGRNPEEEPMDNTH